jgi:predicted aspartyl protease
MSRAYDPAFAPPAPVLSVRLAAPGESDRSEAGLALVDTGADGTLVPARLLEQIEAIGVGTAILRGVLGEAREVHLYEVDLQVETLTMPGILVASDEQGEEILLGRNVLNKLILLLDGPSGTVEHFESRPIWR